jgi:DnaJ-class molecular chaperone
MTREGALKNLNLPPEADSEAIEKAYQRLARRYPPEFQPEKFRIIDESYRQLTSLPEMLERLLSPSGGALRR